MSEPVFTLILPLDLAPTLNVYAGLQGWRKAKMREAIDFRILGLRSSWTARGCTSRRRVVVTRHSSREPDELACDVLGAKIAIDRLVQAGILAGDSRKHLEREAHWQAAKPREGKLVVDVYDIVEAA